MQRVVIPVQAGIQKAAVVRQLKPDARLHGHDAFTTPFFGAGTSIAMVPSVHDTGRSFREVRFRFEIRIPG